MIIFYPSRKNSLSFSDKCTPNNYRSASTDWTLVGCAGYGAGSPGTSDGILGNKALMPVDATDLIGPTTIPLCIPDESGIGTDSSGFGGAALFAFCYPIEGPGTLKGKDLPSVGAVGLIALLFFFKQQSLLAPRKTGTFGFC